MAPPYVIRIPRYAKLEILGCKHLQIGTISTYCHQLTYATLFLFDKYIILLLTFTLKYGTITLVIGNEVPKTYYGNYITAIVLSFLR